MIVSFHATHSSAGATVVTEIIGSLEKNAESFMKSISSVSEYVILRTCNRFEIYAATYENEMVIKAFERFAKANIPYGGNETLWYILEDEASVRHIFRVTCGLDSLVVGEDQIQGQVKEAYMRSKAEGTVQTVLGGLFDRALFVGKRVRSETSLNTGAVSVGSAAVELVKRRLGDLRGRNVAVIGAGDMATVVAKCLQGTGVSAIFVSTRTYEHAKELANSVNGTAIGFENLQEIICNADVIIVATSAPHVILDRKMVEPAVKMRNDPLLIIDISVPRNVSEDVSAVTDVKVETMEGIRAISLENLDKRRKEIHEAESIVNDELKKLEKENMERKANIIIGEIGKKVAEIRAEALSIAITRAESGSDLNEVFDDFSKALISRIMAEPYEKLKEASRTGRNDVCEVATDLFGVEKK